MYIKQVVLDGFKSYAQRTEISGFDPKFNAITGLNGSGKSNILDAICFLLGISNLSQVTLFTLLCLFLHTISTSRKSYTLGWVRVGLHYCGQVLHPAAIAFYP